MAVTVGPPWMGVPRVTMLMPLAPPSLDPTESVITMLGNVSKNASFRPWLNSAAVEEIANMLLVSRASGLAIISSISGRAIASPVIISRFTRSASTSRHTSAASKRSMRMMRLPVKLPPITLHCAAPCMSGMVGRLVIANALPFSMNSVGSCITWPLRRSMPPPRAISTS